MISTRISYSTTDAIKCSEYAFECFASGNAVENAWLCFEHAFFRGFIKNASSKARAGPGRFGAVVVVLEVALPGRPRQRHDRREVRVSVAAVPGPSPASDASFSLHLIACFLTCMTCKKSRCICKTCKSWQTFSQT